MPKKSKLSPGALAVMLSIGPLKEMRTTDHQVSLLLGDRKKLNDREFAQRLLILIDAVLIDHHNQSEELRKERTARIWKQIDTFAAEAADADLQKRKALR